MPRSRDFLARQCFWIRFLNIRYWYHKNWRHQIWASALVGPRMAPKMDTFYEWPLVYPSVYERKFEIGISRSQCTTRVSSEKLPPAYFHQSLHLKTARPHSRWHLFMPIYYSTMYSTVCVVVRSSNWNKTLLPSCPYFALIVAT